MASTGINPYTAYQLYPNAQMGQVVKTSAPAYTGEPYQCPFSQRAPAYMFKDFVQKQHYDAANTGCCEEPVTPFYTRPQYQDTTTPTETRDCVEQVAMKNCGAVQVGVSYYGAQSICSSYKFPSFDVDVRCPLDCVGIENIKQTGVKQGTYGRFIFSGEKTMWDWVVRYEVDDALVQTVWDTCAGTVNYTESVCVGRTIDFTINANIDNANSCYCDCCGDNGRFTGPTHGWATPSMTATWENLLDLSGGTAKLDTACKDGSLSAMVYVPTGLGSDYSLPWSVAPAYIANNVSKVHKWEGTPGTLGGATQPACCGATVRYTGDDGCSYSGYEDKVLARKAGSPAWSPSDATLYTGTAYTIKITGVCNKSGIVDLALTPTGVDTAGWGSVSVAVDGEISRSIGTAALTDTFAYKGCCGTGSIAVSGNDGCGTTGSATYYMRNPVGANGAAIGYYYRCQASDLQRAEWGCTSALTNWGHIHTYPSHAECLIAIDSQAATDCDTLSGCTDCCYYGKEMTVLERGFIFCNNDSNWSTDPTCCNFPTTPTEAAWIHNTSGTCCPN